MRDTILKEDNNLHCSDCFWFDKCEECSEINDKEVCEHFMPIDFDSYNAYIDEQCYRICLDDRGSSYQELVDEMNDGERFYE